jgi:hypothetical protein
METDASPLTDEAVTRIEAAEEALDAGTGSGQYDGCLFCQVDVVLELVAERLRAAGHAEVVAEVFGA